NLCEFIKLMIQNEERGIFHPQNKEVVQTSEMVRLIAEIHGNKICLTKVGNFLIHRMSRINLINKVFGNLYYEESMSCYNKGTYQRRKLKESIKLTERK